jgi:YggT family protein
MSGLLLLIISWLANILTVLIIVDSVLSWILPPSNPLREATGRVLQPLYAPIRRVIPPAGMMDFTPLVLLLLVQAVARIAASLIR